MAKPFRLSRRSMLLAAGAAIPLPFLEVMGEGRARGAPTGRLRYLVMFAGMGLAGKNVPSMTGPGYALTPAFQPLATVKDKVSLISGLYINTGKPAGPGQVEVGTFHNQAMAPLLTGHRGEDGKPIFRSATSDQVVADAIGSSTTHRALAYRAQPVPYVGGYGQMSARQSGSSVVPVTPIASPALAFDQLFTGFTGPSSGGTATPTTAPGNDKSVLDLVLARSQRLMGRVGKVDRERLERHFNEIREIEKRIAAISSGPPPSGSTACGKPAAPGPDPAGKTLTSVSGAASGYSEEDKRARVLCDLVHMAYACDLTRVASLMLTFGQSQMNSQPITGQNYELHAITHGSALGANQIPTWNKACAWHVGHFAYLVDKLAKTPGDSGRSLLDDTAAVLTFSGGEGIHGVHNMTMVVAGRPDTMKMGQHIRVANAHPAQVFLTAMHSVGVSKPALGEVSGTLSAMLV